jgi:hypothetical protein
VTLSGDRRKALHAELQSLKLRQYNSCMVTDDDVFLGMIVQLKCEIIERGENEHILVIR